MNTIENNLFQNRIKSHTKGYQTDEKIYRKYRIKMLLIKTRKNVINTAKIIA